MSSAPVRVVGVHKRVLDTGDLSIDEWSGQATSQEDRFSVAKCRARAGTTEPWRTSAFDEWFCVIEGALDVEVQQPAWGGADDEAPTSAVTRRFPAGTTGFVPKGTRFKPHFPVDCVYVPICIPAFTPDRCRREHMTLVEDQASAELLPVPAAAEPAGVDGVSDAAAAGGTGHVLPAAAASATVAAASPEVLYHVCPAKDWVAAKTSGVYYPAGFEADGCVTHATGAPSRIVAIANHDYRDSPGDCVR
jgi:hypothetical protein